MAVDVANLIESLQRGVGLIPPVAIAVVLLAGPTIVLIGYRLIGYRLMAGRRKRAADVEAVPLWVCQDCRSVNKLRVTRCYRCGVERDRPGDIEVIVNAPTAVPTFFEVPVGSPFAALSESLSRAPTDGPGTPVMADPRSPWDAIPVGPGRADEYPVTPARADANRTRGTSPTTGETSPPNDATDAPLANDLTSAVEPRR